MFCVVLLFFIVPVITGCRGGVDENISGFLNLTGKKGDAVERNLEQGYGGFKPPRDVEQLWRYWLQNYEQAMEVEEKGPVGDQIDRSPAGGWPPRWTGLGSGHGGAPPPPWAYVPIDTGLPAFCYLPAEKGTCNETLLRFGYNGITQKCQEFNYTGCGENQNNFATMENCEVACMIVPISGCDLETQQYIET